MEGFIQYLKDVEKKADNTVLAYKKDVNAFKKFLEQRGGKTFAECKNSDAAAYIIQLNNENKSKATINRKISSLRSFYEYKIAYEGFTLNPFDKIKSARNDKRTIEFLTVEEVEALLELPDDSVKGKRDRAILEFMYGTGVRVSELPRVTFGDLNLKMNFVTCRDGNGEGRIIPVGSYLKRALVDYIENSYETLKGRLPDSDDPVFINFRGEALTRQAIWKMLKNYGEKIGLGDKMTPQILRDSFAVHILQNGGDLKTLQELMGFDDISVGIAYLSVTNIRVKDVYNRTHPRA